MTKYTINKAFEKTLPTNIWKIEVDAIQALIAIETRNLDGSEALFHVFNFQGECVMSSFKSEGKEWTLDSLQDGFLILKRVGEHTPIQEGIQIINSKTQERVFTSYEFILLDVYCHKIHARHRSISSGETISIEISTGKYSPSQEHNFKLCPNRVQYPITYTKVPEFLQNINIEGPLWLNKIGAHYIWSFHEKSEEKHKLILAISDLNQLLDKLVILEDMDRMIPQPYFQIENQVFFMSFNKREIISYLL